MYSSMTYTDLYTHYNVIVKASREETFSVLLSIPTNSVTIICDQEIILEGQEPLLDIVLDENEDIDKEYYVPITGHISTEEISKEEQEIDSVTDNFVDLDLNPDDDTFKDE